MKKMKCIVRPNKVDDVKEALGKLGVSGMTVTEVRGHGHQKGHTAVYRGQEYAVSLLPKMELEVVVSDSLIDDADAGLDKSTGSSWYRDGDGDGYGGTSITAACTLPSGDVGCTATVDRPRLCAPLDGPAERGY